MTRETKVTMRCLLAIMLLVALANRSIAQNSGASDATRKYYDAQVTIFSYVPGKELSTFSQCAAGLVRTYGAVGLGFATSEGQYIGRYTANVKDGKFIIACAMTLRKLGAQISSQTLSYDLSDLSPKSAELAHDIDGRVYKMSIVPKIDESEPPAAQFKASEIHLDGWHFKDSAIIFNSQELGGFGGSGGALAYCDIPGAGKLEFSLLQLKDAQPIGTLNHGKLTINHGDDTFEMTNVCNGDLDAPLPGGPYIVWVRWEKPSMSASEYREALKAQIADVREKIKNGDTYVTPRMLKLMQRQLDGGGFSGFSFGTKSVRDSDLVDPRE